MPGHKVEVLSYFVALEVVERGSGPGNDWKWPTVSSDVDSLGMWTVTCPTEFQQNKICCSRECAHQGGQDGYHPRNKMMDGSKRD